MEKKLEKLTRDYLLEIESACKILIKEINLSKELNLESKIDFLGYKIKHKINEYKFGNAHFRINASGCTFTDLRIFLDWDFGYRSRWCGVNPWKFAMTMRRNDCQDEIYFDGTYVKKQYDCAVSSGIMYQKNELYYFVIPESEMFKPKFPEVYDTVIISKGGLSAKISRNKTFEKFVRKSNKVWNNSGISAERYNLEFFEKGILTYCIAYSDITFPEGAVKIMNESILNNLRMISQD